jgi:hypothetical protein
MYFDGILNQSWASAPCNNVAMYVWRFVGKVMVGFNSLNPTSLWANSLGTNGRFN